MNTPGPYRRPLALLIVALALLLLAVSTGHWRGAGTGPQVQVPIFYDSHYIFARPWTQAQSAPGVPPPAPLALYGPNRVTQPFNPGHDRIRLLRVRLSGVQGATVEYALREAEAAADAVLAAGTLTIDSSGWHAIHLPTSLDGRDAAYALTLAAPAATAEQPVHVYTVGGDRLGNSLRLNEYARPGNVALQIYARGAPGGWWLDAMAEQILPTVFQIRLQQYKPLKGAAFAGLLLLTGGLTAVAFLAALPPRVSARRAALWSAAGALGVFLVWQLASGRLLIAFPPVAAPVVSDARVPPAPAPAPGEARVVYDLTQQLWTGIRLPDAYLVETTSVDGRPAIVVPPGGEVAFDLRLPLEAHLVGAVQPGIGQPAGAVTILWNEQVLFNATDRASQPLNLDLSALGGNSGRLRLRVAADAGAPWYWIQPQIVSDGGWLRAAPPADLVPVGATLAERVQLHGYTMLDGQLTLYWEALASGLPNAVVFVHVVGEDGLLAQIDRAPVDGTYPLSVWQPGMVIADAYNVDALLANAPPGTAVTVGLYDGATLVRWPAVSAEGARYTDDAIPLDAADVDG